jgi:hypothetical protein
MLGVIENQTFEKQIISQKLMEWNDRKQSLFSNPRYIEISLKHLQNIQSE